MNYRLQITTLNVQPTPLEFMVFEEGLSGDVISDKHSAFKHFCLRTLLHGKCIEIKSECHSCFIEKLTQLDIKLRQSRINTTSEVKLKLL